jgi:hypothetical protein
MFWLGYIWGYRLPDLGYRIYPLSRSGNAMPLTDTEIRRSKPRVAPCKLSDAHGLYFLVNPSGSRLWRWKYRIGGKEKLMAFGS